ncbi:MAG: thiazole biosynthesis adenylyltransferase ThiF [Polyangiales bacterium]
MVSDATVAIVGVGGLGAPVGWALARAGVRKLVLVDDDLVDRSNLHRQILFGEADVGHHKLDASVAALRTLAPALELEAIRARLHPGNVAVLAGADVIVECSDRYAVKFLVADAARLLGKPVVHGAAIRWLGTAMATSAQGAPCYRCLFEDVPSGAQSSCDVSGVVGPVCGIVGALQADLALGVLAGRGRFGVVTTVDGLRGTLRCATISRRSGCPLCGDAPTIDRIEPSRYTFEPC